MSEKPAMEVDNVSLQYRTTIERKPTLKSRIAHLGRAPRVVRTVQALDGVSLEVPRGSFLGVVGANGAGKSTLIRVMAGILPPSEGQVTIRGRVTTLLASGIGFNAELTGRENIMIGGLASGMSRAEVQERTEAIIEFADLGEFIDFPMKTYSSGMHGRLGFAVSVHLDPDILLIDEGLSAGDAQFKQKATDKISELLQEAGAIVLVSHGLKTILEKADQCVWLHKGKVLGLGDPQEVVDAYTDWTNVKQSDVVLEDV